MAKQTEASRKAKHYDIAIVGGGMVGAALANALATSKLNIAVIEKHEPDIGLPITDKTPFAPRVSALTMASRNLLDNLDVWASIAEERISPYRHMQVWDAEGTGHISFHAAELAQPQLGFIVENDLVVHCLRQALQRFDNVDLYCPDKLNGLDIDENRARLTLGNQDITASLVVGADGAQSRVRQLAGLDLHERDYGQHAIVATVRTEQSHQSTAWQRFLRTGPLAFLPLLSKGCDDHCCSIVWSLEESQVEALLALDDQQFAEKLGEAFEHRLGKVELCSPRFNFPLRERLAKDSVFSRLALIGDAAHTIHPLAGQGVNLGLLDVAVLAEEILHATNRGLEPGRLDVLQRYQRRRKVGTLAMMGAMEAFRSLFGETALPVRWLRNAGMSWLDQISPVKNHIVAQAMGLSGDLPELAQQRRE